MSLPLGSRLGPYEIVDRVGAGGMGEVYKARDTRLGRTVAIKILLADAAHDAGRRRRFEHEARAASALNHPNICTLYDIGRDRDTDFLVMEFVEGETLAQRARGGPLPVAEAVRIGAQIAGALGAAHQRGLVHRDIKPSNVMLARDGAVKILDFGIATRREPVSDTAITHSIAQTTAGTVEGALVGTPAYMSPEQITGDPVTPATDVYGAGCVLYELLAGRPPFEGTSAVAVLHRVLTETPRPVAELRPDVPARLGEVVARALVRDPRQRYADGAHLERALREPALGDETSRPPAEAATVAEGATRAARQRVKPRRSWQRRAAAAIIGAIVLTALAWFVVPRLAQPALAFNERDFVLVADVENTTGEPAFDLALKSALETDLRQSRYVNVLDSSQVRNALLLMRQKPETPVVTQVARDLCRRTGARALLAPRILRAGEAYQVGVSLVEPASGRLAGEVQVTVRGREQVLLSAIDQVTRALRSRLGESLASIAKTDPPFAQYTTSSPEALQLLVLAQRAWEVGDFAKAERGFGEALQRDPRFAAARASLGLLDIQFLNRPEEGRKLLAQAVTEEGTVSQREHLAMRALNKQFVTNDPQGALDDYRFISELYPDFYPAYNNSGRILAQMSRYREAASMYERASSIDPRSATPLWNLWFLCVRQLRDAALAEKTARKLIAIFPDNANAQHTLAWSLVAERRFAEAEQQMRAVLKIDALNAYALPNLGHLLFRRGDFADAATVYRQIIAEKAAGRFTDDVAHVQLSLGLALKAAGQPTEARKVLDDAETALRRGGKGAPSIADQSLLAAVLAAQGRRSEALALAARLERVPDAKVEVNYGLAEMWCILGDRPAAIRHLEAAYAAGYGDTYMPLIDPALATVNDDPAVDRLAPRAITNRS